MQEVTILQSLDEDFRFLAVQFSGSAKTYTYKTLDTSIKEGDTVIVASPSQGLTFVTVVDVLLPTEVDFTAATYQFKWVVQKLDTSQYLKLSQADAEMQKQINKAKAKKTTEQHINKLKELMTEQELAMTAGLTRL